MSTHSYQLVIGSKQKTQETHLTGVFGQTNITMQEVKDFFRNLFEYEDFRSFWQSGSWTNFHGWFYIISDLLVWSAYFVIPTLTLFYIIKKRRGTQFRGLFFLFACFILLSGATYFVDALMFWVPVYRVSALARFITGLVSWVAVFYVIKILPKAFSLRSGQEFQAEIDMRINAEKELKEKNEQLQEAERIAKLGYVHWNVAEEKIHISDTSREILGLNKIQKFTYETYQNLIHPDDAKQIEKVIDTIFIKKFFPDFYCRILTQEEERHLLIRGQVILTESGLISVVKGTIQDVTEQRLYLQKIQSQNQRLKDIAWIQSHKVRAPVASILGLIQLFNKEELNDPINLQVLDGLNDAVNTLDEVIKEINSKTETMKPTPKA